MRRRCCALSYRDVCFHDSKDSLAACVASSTSQGPEHGSSPKRLPVLGLKIPMYCPSKALELKRDDTILNSRIGGSLICERRWTKAATISGVTQDVIAWKHSATSWFVQEADFVLSIVICLCPRKDSDFEQAERSTSISSCKTRLARPWRRAGHWRGGCRVGGVRFKNIKSQRAERVIAV